MSYSRKPPGFSRSEFIVSPNVGQTLHVCRQAVVDAKRAVAWLAAQGYERIGILGTSLGSCLSMLTSAHEPLIRAQAFQPRVAVLRGCRMVGSFDPTREAGARRPHRPARLRRIWMPISPYPYLDRMRDKRLLLVYARYDLTFPVDLSRMLVDQFRRRGIEHDLALPCGHYSTGVTRFKWLDGLTLCRFLSRNL